MTLLVTLQINWNRNALLPFPPRKRNISNTTKQHRTSKISLKNSWPLPSPVPLYSLPDKYHQWVQRRGISVWGAAGAWSSTGVPWQWPTLQNNGRKDAIYDYSVFQFPLTFNYPSLLDPECYSIHQLLAALNAFAFPALASSCTESTGSVNWMETKSRLGVQGWRREQGEVFPNKQFCAFLSITWQPCFGEH